MAATLSASNSRPDHLCDEAFWAELYPWLYTSVRSFIYGFRVSCWYGQEEDMIDDVVQETLRRTIEYSQRAKQGEAIPIGSLERLMVVIAKNIVRDVRRHDQRIVRLPDEQALLAISLFHDVENPLDAVTEAMSEEQLFQWIAREVVHFPPKQRRAVFIDVANRMSFDAEPTPLQNAFLTVGIDLREYQLPLPTDPVERSRHASLLSYAYKRLQQRASVEEVDPQAA